MQTTFDFKNYEFNELLTSVFYAFIKGSINNKALLLEATHKAKNEDALTLEQQEAVLKVFGIYADAHNQEQEYLKTMYRSISPQSILKYIKDAMKQEYISKYDFAFLMILANKCLGISTNKELEQINFKEICRELNTTPQELRKQIYLAVK